MINETVLPRSTVLVRTLEVVGIKEGQRFSVGVKDFKHAYVRLIDRQVLSFFESDAVQLVRSKEDAVVQHMLELEIWLHLGLVEIVFGFPHLLRIVLPIGRAEFEAAVFGID